MFDGLTEPEKILLVDTLKKSRDAIGEAYAEISILLDRFTDVYEKVVASGSSAEEIIEEFITMIGPFMIRDTQRLVDPRVVSVTRDAEPRVKAELDKLEASMVG